MKSLAEELGADVQIVHAKTGERVVQKLDFFKQCCLAVVLDVPTLADVEVGTLSVSEPRGAV